MIGDKIKAARLAKGFTQEELAARMGLTKQCIQRWEKNKVKTIPVIDRISIVYILDIPLKHLLTDTERILVAHLERKEKI